MASENKSSRCIALALSGGNALGAYEAGSYEALHDRGYRPDIIGGASVGAVNGAIIAGNMPEQRVAKLREFWNQAAQDSMYPAALWGGRVAREIGNKLHTMQTLLWGRPGLFVPRLSHTLSMLPGMPSDVSLYDTQPLVATLERVVDFDLLNQAVLPLMATAVDVETGQGVVFDSRKQRLEPKHFLASTAFLPLFPPVEIDGRCFADPGVFSNLPIDSLLDPPQAGNLLCFAVDLFEANGERPHKLDTSLERAQDISFSSQSKRTIEGLAREHRLRRTIHDLSLRALAAGQSDAALSRMADEGRNTDLAIVYTAYRPPRHELAAKMLEFSRTSIDERWAIGLEDMHAALDRLESGRASVTEPGYAFYDGRRSEPPDAMKGKPG